MKTLTTLIGALALLAPAALFAANFEGKITMKMTSSDGEAMPFTYSIKSGLTRVDFDTGRGMSGAVIMDPAKQQSIILMPAQKMYMVHALPKPGEGPAGGDQNDVSIEKTNEHAKILGYDTTKYIAKSRDNTSEVWVTDQLGTFMGMGRGGPAMGPRRGRGANAQQAWEDAFKGKDAFPLRVVTKNNSGKETFQMEATAIDKASLPDSLFTPPADYQKFDMGNMMRGMMPGGMRPPQGGGGD